ncbi:MAG: type 4a pilus biogenesis protein PilO [Candidatus Eisenbacteria bacterium]|nr:type 4a pilus biogenesis protein PilO [Candidatus Eisenbacteria bacterium]
MNELLRFLPRRTLTALAIAGLTVAGVHFGILAPLQRATVRLNTQANTLAADVAQVSQSSRELTEWLRQHRGTPEADPRALDSMSPELAVPALLQRISELGARHDVHVTGIRPEAPDAPISVDVGDGAARTYVRVPVHLVASARYRSLGAFLEDLQGQGGLALVRTVHLTLSEVRGMVTVELWIDAYGRVS